jgi:ferrous iron transport protein B
VGGGGARFQDGCGDPEALLGGLAHARGADSLRISRQAFTIGSMQTEAGGRAAEAAGAGKKIFLIGNPNVGKSVIFGVLTGRYVTVSNYPGTTVEVTEGSLAYEGIPYQVIDTPGVNDLIPMSEDEMVTRDILLSEPAFCVLQVIDAKNLKRGLLITLELAEMKLPMLVLLNMMDEAVDRGISIDVQGLEEFLQVPVIPTVATQRKGLRKTTAALGSAVVSSCSISYTRPVEEAVRKLVDLLPEGRISRRSLALMVLGGDPGIEGWLRSCVSATDLEEIRKIREETQRPYGAPLSFQITQERIRALEPVIDRVFRKSPGTLLTRGSRLQRATTHPVWGIPVLCAVLAALYLFVGRFGAGTCVDFFENVLFAKFLLPLLTRMTNAVFPAGFFRDLIMGPYGIVTMALTYSIAIILPIVGTFFIAFGILEDSGYLPRLAIMVNRVFRVMGLNGKAVLPMILGLGCDTMATITARILESRKERVIVTLLLALGVPCSAQLGVILAMLGRLSFWGTAIWAGVILLVMFLVGYLSSKVIQGADAHFILEIPPLRVPKIRNIMIKTLARVEWYLKEAVPLFILGTLVLFFCNRYGVLEGLEKVSRPLIGGFLGLPEKASEAFLIGFLRRDYGAAGLFALARAGELDKIQILVSLVTITLFVPCIANVFIIVKERGWKTALAIVGFIFPFSFLVGGVLNAILRHVEIPL